MRERSFVESKLAEVGLLSLFWLNREYVLAWIRNLSIRITGSRTFEALRDQAKTQAYEIGASASRAFLIMAIAFVIELVVIFLSSGNSTISLPVMCLSLAAMLFAKVSLFPSLVKIQLAVELWHVALHGINAAASAVRSTLPGLFELGRESVYKDKPSELASAYHVPNRLLFFFTLFEILITIAICSIYHIANRPLVILLMLNALPMGIFYVNGFGVSHYQYMPRMKWIAVLSILASFVYWFARPAYDEYQADQLAEKETLREKAATENKELEPVYAEVKTLELKSYNLKPAEMTRLNYLREVIDWHKKGRHGAKPVMPIPTCRDEIDNNHNGFKDRTDYNCYRLDPTCTKSDRDCRNVFGTVNQGKPLGAYYRYFPDLTETMPAPPPVLPEPPPQPVFRPAENDDESQYQPPAHRQTPAKDKELETARAAAREAALQARKAINEFPIE